MNRISELKDILSEALGWHKSRLDCFTKMLVALFAVRTVNLQEIALAMLGPATASSHYRRLQRFFAFFHIDLTQIAVWIFQLFFSSTSRVYLSLDRTNWFWGKTPINALVLSIAYEGVAIPLFWKLLPKDGTSNTAERIEILQRFIDTFGTQCIEGLLGDREFVGGKWFRWLMQQKIRFCIRIKENTLLSIFRGKGKTAKLLFQDLALNTQKRYENYVTVFECKLRIAAGRSHTGELLIVVTNADYQNPVSIYLRRWEIECLFAALKTHGFRFEETHITHPERIEKLMVLLAIGFAWAHKVGEWRAEIKPIAMKKHQDKTIRAQYTYFRYGLDFIREAILRIETKWEQFQQCVQLFQPTLMEVTT